MRLQYWVWGLVPPKKVFPRDCGGPCLRSTFLIFLFPVTLGPAEVESFSQKVGRQLFFDYTSWIFELRACFVLRCFPGTRADLASAPLF